MDSLTETSASYLCSICSKIFSQADAIEEEIHGDWGGIQLPIGKPSYPHHRSLAELKRSVEEKCYICIRLWLRATPTADDTDQLAYDPDKLVDIRYALTAKGPRDPKSINVWFMEGKLNMAMPWFYDRHSVMPSKLIESHVNIPSIKIGIQSTCEQARKWLSTCRNEHELCSIATGQELPTRLVKVDRSNSILSGKLCDSSSLPPDTKYTALSHCWGKTLFSTLTKENLQQWKIFIPITSLRQVFQDAILMTYELGFQYIWIDSLCIIQNSDEGADWHRESPLMNRAYCNSVCNLSATGFTDGRNGLFVSTESTEIYPPSIDCSKFVGDGIGYSIMSVNDWLTDIAQAPLGSRGWVFQEHVMSPRILHFGSREVFWECYSTTSSQLFPRGFPPGHKNVGLKRSIARPLLNYTRLGQNQLYSQWNKAIVREYTGRKLTYGSDRLPALSGLAKVFVRILKDRYVAGLWEGDMHRGLLWHGTGDFKVSPTYRAPTWSWASIDGPITAMSLEDKLWHAAAKMKEVVTIPLTDDDTGQVIGGHLRLSGTLFKLRLQYLSDKVVRSSLGVKAKFDDSSSNPSVDATEVLFYSTELGAPRDLAVDGLTDDLRTMGEIFLMPLLYYRNNDLNECMTGGLALCLVDGVNGCYKKIGSIRTYGSRILEALIRICRVRTEETRFYEEYDGDMYHTVKIV